MNKLLFPGLLSAVSMLSACGGGGGGGGPAITELSTVELSNVQIAADTNQPFLVNHRIPFSFEIQGFSENAAVEEEIAIGFYFEEKNPVDPQAPRGCDVNAIGLTVQGNGQTELVDEFFLWPVSECIELAADDAEVLLKVRAFRGEERLSEQELLLADQLPELRLALGEPDVEYKLEAESSVAILAAQNEQIPALSASSLFVLNGQDPYYGFVAAEDIPSDLQQEEDNGEASTIEEDLNFGFDIEQVKQFTKLPSKLTLTYSIAPASVPQDKFPLTFALEDEDLAIEDLADADVIFKVDALDIENIELGFEDAFTHDLFIEGETAEALGFGGIYENESLFVVEGCITMDFAQQSNDDISGTDNDCFAVEVLLERELNVATSDQPELDFDEEMERKPGNRRVGIEAKFGVVNQLTAAGLTAGVDGAVTVKGKIGKNYSLELAGVRVAATLGGKDDDDDSKNDINSNDKPSSIQIQLRAVNQIVFSAFDENADPDEDQFKDVSPRFDKNQLIGSLGFGVGPVNFGFQANMGGRVENTVDIVIESNRDNPGSVCEEKFSDLAVIMDGCGALKKVATPEFGLQAVFFGGLNIRIIRVGVEAELNLMNIAFPVTSELNLGQASTGDFLVNANIGWDAQFVLIKGNVKLVASIRLIFRRRGFSVNLVSFSSRPVKLDLLDINTGTLRLAD